MHSLRALDHCIRVRIQDNEPLRKSNKMQFACMTFSNKVVQLRRVTAASPVLQYAITPNPPFTIIRTNSKGGGW